MDLRKPINEHDHIRGNLSGTVELIEYSDYQCPFTVGGAKSIKLLKHGKLISYPGFPHGMPATETATINKDILAFIKS